MHKIVKKIILLILLPAICWLFFNAVYYRHFHQLSTGITISHAHPYDKSENCASNPFASHNHTEDEFIIYDVISNTILLIVISSFIALSLFEILLKQYRFKLQENFNNSYPYLINDYRGPPNRF